MKTAQREDMETREWKKRVVAGVDATGIPLRKEFPASFQKVKDDDQPDSRLVDFVLNTGGADRYADTIKGDGWELESYFLNPVVLWHHNSSAFAGPAPMPHAGLPVARGVNLEVIGDSLIGSAEFPEEPGENASEAAKFIETVYQFVKKGFLNAVSVGFEPLEWTYDEERGGYNFIRQELLEFSVVPIPADSGALRRAVEEGIDTQPIYQWAVDLLESGDEIPVHRERLEAVAKGLGLGRGIRFFDLSSSEIRSTIKDRVSVSPEDLAKAEKELESTRRDLEGQTLLWNEAKDQISHLDGVVQDLAKKRAEELVGEELFTATDGDEARLVGTMSELIQEVCEKEDRMWDPKIHTEGSTVITYLDEDGNPLEVEDIVSIRQEEAPVDEDGVLVLRVVSDEPQVEEADTEDTFRIDPEALNKMVADAAMDEVQELKNLFTRLTGKVIR